MSWTARLSKAPDGELRLQFGEPLDHLDMDRATARHLAKLLTVAADGKRVAPLDGIPSGSAASGKKRRASAAPLWCHPALVHVPIDYSSPHAPAHRRALIHICGYKPIGSREPANG
jgi:hypothetical protein